MLPGKGLTTDNLFAHKTDISFHFKEIQDQCGKCVMVTAKGWHVTLVGQDLTLLSLRAVAFLIENATRVAWGYDGEGNPEMTVHCDMQAEAAPRGRLTLLAGASQWLG